MIMAVGEWARRRRRGRRRSYWDVECRWYGRSVTAFVERCHGGRLQKQDTKEGKEQATGLSEPGRSFVAVLDQDPNKRTIDIRPTERRSSPTRRTRKTKPYQVRVEKFRQCPFHENYLYRLCTRPCYSPCYTESLTTFPFFPFSSCTHSSMHSIASHGRPLCIIRYP